MSDEDPSDGGADPADDGGPADGGSGADAGGSDEGTDDAHDGDDRSPGDGGEPDSPGADGDDPDPADDAGPSPPPGEPDPASAAEVEQLRRELREFREDVDDRTLHRDEVEADLRRFVRLELGRGHARGWGPYLVLLYGTLMTLGAFYYLRGPTAIAAMIVIWLSTLGLFVVFVAVGAGLSLTQLPRRLYRRVRDR